MMSFSQHDRSRRGRQSAAPAAATEQPGPTQQPNPVLDLQRTLGNREVSRLLRAEGGAAQAPAGAVAVQQVSPVTIQARALGATGGNAHEVEAERVADHIALAGNGAPPAGHATRSLGMPGIGGAALPASVKAALGQSGQPLDAGTRARMEPHFGVDLGAVRVHTDQHAAESARSVGARAYTVGSHIAFGAGRFAPETAAGSHLLAHELTHVVQQSQSGAASLDCAPDPNLSLEESIDAKRARFLDAGTAGNDQVFVTSVFAEGHQVYEGRPSKTGGCFVWELLWPDAVLYDSDHRRIGSHYAGPTWESDADKSAVRAELSLKDPVDSPSKGAVAWLELPTIASRGRGIFSDVTLVRRISTVGGAPPKCECGPMTPASSAAGCPTASGQRLRVPYKATYHFFKPKRL